MLRIRRLQFTRRKGTKVVAFIALVAVATWVANGFPMVSSALAQAAAGVPSGASTTAGACTSGFNASMVAAVMQSGSGATPPPKNAAQIVAQTYAVAMVPVLRQRLVECYQALQSMRSSLREPYSIDIACNPDDSRGHISGLITEIAQLNDPANLSANLPKLVADETVLATVLDTYCNPLFAQGRSYSNTPSSLLTRQSTPTIYVLLAQGGSTSGSGSQNTSSSNQKSSGAGGSGGSTSPSASTDNPTALLLFEIAEQLSIRYCTIARSEWGPHSIPDCATRYKEWMFTNHVVQFLPESQWTMEDFRNQCVGDPYEPAGTKGQAHGTIGGVVINGATTSEDGSFHLVTVTGATEAQYVGEVLSCIEAPPDDSQSIQAGTSSLTAETIFSDRITTRVSRTVMSLFPIALAGTLVGTNLTAKATLLGTPNVLPSSGVPLPAADFSAYTNYLEAGAIGQFAAGLSTMVIGNPASGLTAYHTYEQWGQVFAQDLFDKYCQIGMDKATGKVASKKSSVRLCVSLEPPPTPTPTKSPENEK